MPDPHDELTAAEAEALARLPGREEPPAWLEESIVNELKRSGHIVARGATLARPAGFLARAVAASILVFVAGLLAGLYLPRQAATPTPASTPAGRQFVLFLYEDETYQTPAADRAADRVEEYRAWARGLARAGHLVDGQKLKDDVELLPAGSSALGEGLGTLAGYFILAARDGHEALGLAADCPHLKYHGRIAVREIDPV